MGLFEDLFDLDCDGDIDSDDDLMFMVMMDQLDKESCSGGGGCNDGCYIASCVYGSYDCPQVWTLRRFRDFQLGRSLLGRLFIRAYYAISPTVVSIWGDKPSFQHFWRRKLDVMVAKLNAEGVSDFPYEDTDWRKG